MRDIFQAYLSNVAKAVDPHTVITLPGFRELQHAVVAVTGRDWGAAHLG